MFIFYVSSFFERINFIKIPREDLISIFLKYYCSEYNHVQPNRGGEIQENPNDVKLQENEKVLAS